MTGSPSNLPTQLTSFVGRLNELEQVQAALAETRLLTLTGAGGCGKTRLALQATAAADRFPDGTWWVELAPLADPGLVAQTISAVLGVRPLPGMSHIDAAVARLAERRALLVLDNCEHLLSACAEVVETLLGGCPGVSILATSRTPLGVPGETDWRVPSLSLPKEPGDVAASDAVLLFSERATKVRPGFAIDEETGPAVAQICRELDGIPLAIELAAARTRMMSLEQIAAGLGDRFHLLTGGGRSAPPRHQTLRASVAWSHDLLTDEERALFRRLAVFIGGFTLEAAPQVCSGDGLERDRVLDLLTSLVDKSLVVVEEAGRSVRYRLLETIRQYALELLSDSGEAGEVRNRHRDFFLALAEEAEPELNSHRQAEWLARLDPETANFTSAIDWAVKSDPERGLRLCVALTFWRRMRGQFAEADAAFARALEAAGSDPSPLRARALRGRAWLSTMAGDLIGPVAMAEEALAMAEELGDDSTAARALDVLALVEVFHDPVASRPLFERSRELAAAAGDDWCRLDATLSLGSSYAIQGAHEPALALLDEALPLVERLGYREYLANEAWLRATVLFQRGQFAAACRLCDRSTQVSEEIGEPLYEGFAVGIRGWIEAERGNAPRALELVAAARERAIASGTGWTLPWLQICGGYSHAALGELEAARNELEAAVAIGAAAGGLGFFDGQALRMLGEILRLSGDAENARGRAEEGLATAKRTKSAWLESVSNLVLASLSLDAEAWPEAEGLVHDALGTLVELGIRLDLPRALDLLAEIATGLESYEESARLLGAAAHCRDGLGVVRWFHHEQRAETLAAKLRAAMGNAAFQAAFEAGRALETDEAIAWVRRARGSRKRPPGGWESLTPTELEVVKLAAEGLSNPEIGERMFISRHTVKVHLSHVFGKLGVKNRSELAAEAARRQPAEGEISPT